MYILILILFDESKWKGNIFVFDYNLVFVCVVYYFLNNLYRRIYIYFFIVLRKLDC